MGNLPLNINYTKAGPAPTMNSPVLAQPRPSTYAGLQAAVKGMPAPTAMYARPQASQLPNFTQPVPGQVPINEPVVPPGTERYSQLPSWYGGFEPARDVGGYSFSDPTQGQTVLSNIPGSGQYVLDKSNPGSLIKSKRSQTREEDFEVLGGRSSKLYQIDHIVPLWAGGSDTPTNKEVLTINEHQKKTSAQAVALTLMAHGKITPTRARVMAMTWKGRDLSDLPEEGDNGLIDLEDAERISAKWDKQESTPMSGFDAIKKAGGGSFWKGFFGSVPEGTEKVVHAIGGVGKGYIPDPAQDVIGGLLEGAASGLTGGWVSAPDENASTTRTVSNLVGNIGGMIIPVGMITRFFGWSTKGIKGLNVLSKASATKNGLTVPQVALGDAEQALLDVANITGHAVKPTGFRGLMSRAGKAAVTGSTYKYVPGFATYGQLTPRGMLGAATGQEEAHPVEQFFNDVVFGIGSGVIPPGLKGMAPMAVLPVITGAMFDPENPSNWVVNAGVMAGLHGMGNYRIPARVGSKVLDSTLGDTSGIVPTAVTARDSFQKEYTDNVSRFFINNVMRPYVGENVSKVRTNADLPIFHTGDQAVDDAMAGQINQWTENALKNLYRAASGKESNIGFKPEDMRNMDYADWQAEAKKIITAGRHLYKQTLEPIKRAEEDAKDILSVAEVVRKNPQIPDRPINEPAIVSTAKDALDDIYMTKSLKQYDKQPPSGEHPTGAVPLTGIASHVNPNVDKIRYYFDMKAKGQASPTIFLVDRPDTAPFWRNLNLTHTADEISANTVTPFSHPENSVQAFGVVVGPKGRETVPLGWVSRKSRISERKNAWNEHPAVKNGAYRPFDESFNKDPIAEHMRKNGIRVLMANIDDGATGPKFTVTGAQKATQSSGEPFIPVTINDRNWIESLKLVDKISQGNTSSKETMSELLGQVNNSINAKQQSAAIAEIRNRIQKPADEVILDVPIKMSGDPVYRDASHGFLKSAKESIEGNSPEEVSNNFASNLGIVIDEKDAIDLFQRKGEVSSRDIFKAISNARETGFVADSTEQTIAHIIKPFFGSGDFKAWPMAKAFPDLRVSGGIKTNNVQKPPMAQLSLPEGPAKAATAPTEAPVAPIEASIAPKEATETLPKAGTSIKPVSAPPPVAETPVSPLASKISMKAAELPLETVTTAQPGRMSLTTLPTSRFTAGKQSFRLPSGLAKVGEQIGFGPIPDQVSGTSAKDIYKIESSEPVTVPATNGGIAEITTPINPVKESSYEMYNRATEILASVDPIYYMKEGQERGGAKSFAAALMGVIKNVQPGPGAGKRAKDVKAGVTRQLIDDAKRHVKNAFDANTNEFGETVPMSWEEIDNIFARLTGGPEIISKGKTPQAWRDIQKVLSNTEEDVAARAGRGYQGPTIESVRSPSAKNTEVPKTEDFFEKDPFFGVSNYDILKARREKAGDDLIQWIDFGKTAQPESYLNAFSYGMDKGLSTMFAGAYTTPEVKQLLGRAFGTEARVSRKMGELYQTENTSKEMKPITQSKEYLEAMGRGDRPGMKTAESKRMEEVAQEQSNSVYQRNTDNLSSDPTVSGSVAEMIGTGDMKLSPSTQIEGKDVGLTRADTALMPGLTSILSGRQTEVAPGEFQISPLEEVGPDAARRGIEDARNILQFILDIHNEAAGAAQKFGSPKTAGTKKKGSSYLQLTGKKQYTGRWATLTAKQRAAVQSETDTHFENLYKEYLNAIGAGINTKFAGVKKAVTETQSQNE